MFVVGFDYKTGKEKLYLIMIIQGKFLPGNTNFHWDYKSRSGFQCAEFKPPIMGLFLVPYMKSITSFWEITAGMYRRCLISMHQWKHEHGIVKFHRKNPRLFLFHKTNVGNMRRN